MVLFVHVCVCVCVCVDVCTGVRQSVLPLIAVLATIGCCCLLRHRHSNVFPMVASHPTSRSSESIHGATSGLSTGCRDIPTAYAVHPPSGSNTDPQDTDCEGYTVRFRVIQLGTKNKWWVALLAFFLFLFQVVPTVRSTVSIEFCCFTLIYIVSLQSVNADLIITTS
jgi:hypothetical protein